jgi:hypothetical protein
MKRIAAISVAAILFLLSSGCARVALKWSHPVVQNMTYSIFEECDLQLAREAIPANLKILEGLAKTDPHNRTILSALAMGFAGYALLFVEEDDPERASGLYIRSRDYALRALRSEGGPEGQYGNVEVLDVKDQEDLQPLFWAAFAWTAWINLNLDEPEAVAQLGKSQGFLERVLAIDSTYFHGLPAILQGSMLSARPALLGGDNEKAKTFFLKGIEKSGGRFFPARYYYARYYAVATQNRDLFRELLEQITRDDPQELKEICLINKVFQLKAAKLLAQEEELFF